MHAAIDIGNSEIKVGLFRDGKLFKTEKVENDSLINYLIQNSVEEVIVSTVSREDELLGELRRQYQKFTLSKL